MLDEECRDAVDALDVVVSTVDPLADAGGRRRVEGAFFSLQRCLELDAGVDDVLASLSDLLEIPVVRLVDQLGGLVSESDEGRHDPVDGHLLTETMTLAGRGGWFVSLTTYGGLDDGGRDLPGRLGGCCSDAALTTISVDDDARRDSTMTDGIYPDDSAVVSPTRRDDGFVSLTTHGGPRRRRTGLTRTT